MGRRIGMLGQLSQRRPEPERLGPHRPLGMRHLPEHGRVALGADFDVARWTRDTEFQPRDATDPDDGGAGAFHEDTANMSGVTSFGAASMNMSGCLVAASMRRHARSNHFGSFSIPMKGRPERMQATPVVPLPI